MYAKIYAILYGHKLEPKTAWRCTPYSTDRTFSSNITRPYDAIYTPINFLPTTQQQHNNTTTSQEEGRTAVRCHAYRWIQLSAAAEDNGKESASFENW